MKIMITYRDSVKVSGREYQQVVGDGVAYLGKATVGGRVMREIALDDGFGVYMVGLLSEGGVDRKEAATQAQMMIAELDKLGLLPTQIWDRKGEVPRIVVRIHGKKAVMELRTFDRQPEIITGQASEKIDEGPYMARFIPETGLGTSPGAVHEVELTGHLLIFLNFIKKMELRQVVRLA
jgi:hypothetical protein